MPSMLPPWRIRLIRTLLGGCALAIGVLLAWAGYFHQLPDHKRVAAWEKVPCQILSWGVTVTPGSAGSRVQPGMSFEYRWGERTYRSSNYDEATDWVIDLRDFEAEGAAARRGPTFCQVNPAKPSEASFRAARLWFPYSLIGGGSLLAVVSAGFLWRTWLPSRRSLDPNLFEQHAKTVIVSGFALLLLSLGGYQAWQFAPHEALRQQLVRHRLVEIPVRARPQRSRKPVARVATVTGSTIALVWCTPTSTTAAAGIRTAGPSLPGTSAVQRSNCAPCSSATREARNCAAGSIRTNPGTAPSIPACTGACSGT